MVNIMVNIYNTTQNLWKQNLWEFGFGKRKIPNFPDVLPSGLWCLKTTSHSVNIFYDRKLADFRHQLEKSRSSCQMFSLLPLFFEKPIKLDYFDNFSE